MYFIVVMQKGQITSDTHTMISANIKDSYILTVPLLSSFLALLNLNLRSVSWLLFSLCFCHCLRHGTESFPMVSSSPIQIEKEKRKKERKNFTKAYLCHTLLKV